MINFVSQLPRDLRTGGFSAMNAAACAALEQRHDVVYAGPVDPPSLPWQKALSKARRLSGLGGDFFAYSERRLANIAAEAGRHTRPEAQLDFFHGFTPWIATRPKRPYAAWSDCDFADYIDIFHDRGQFDPPDLARIEAAEAQWLRGARRVLFTSIWAAERATRRYELDPARVASVGIFGELEPPTQDAYAGAPRFAFVSTNFEAKGGSLALAAFDRLRADHPGAELVIVGAAPDRELGPGVEYAGFLRKEHAQEHQRFRDILAGAAAVVHPSSADISPLLLVEAAFFGCPAIASRAFAIPEIVADRESGLLVDAPVQTAALVAAMRWMLEHPDAYAAMRQAAWRRARAEHGKPRFEARLQAQVDAAIAEGAAEAA